MTEDPEAALLAAVAADPSDLQARAVYADWLEERGDPRGEYLRLEMQLVTLPARVMDLAGRIDPEWIRAVNGRFRISIIAIGPNKIHAIKLVRELTGLGLREALELVDSVSAVQPALLFEDVALERAHEVAAKCQPAMTLQIEPRLPPTMPVAPSGPASYRRPYRLLLVGVTERLTTIQELHVRLAKGLTDARAIVDGVVHGRPFELAAHLDATAVAELAVTFGKLGTIRIEHV